MSGLNETQGADTGSEPTPVDEIDAAALEAFASVDAPADDAAAGTEGGEQGGTGDPLAPADKAAANQPPADAGQAPPAGTTPSDDIWATASPEQRAAFEQLQRDSNLRLRSVQGRQSAADRELARARQRLAELEAARTAPAEPKPQGGTDQSQQGDDDRFKQLREDYPDIAGPLVDVIGELRKELGTLKGGVDQVQQDRTATILSEQQSTLDTKAPDWREVLGDDRFLGWLETAPRAVREAYQRNENQVVDGAEAVWLVAQARAGLGIGTEAPTPTPTPAPQAERRAKQLASGKDMGRTGPAAVSDMPDDADGAALALFRQEEARRTRR